MTILIVVVAVVIAANVVAVAAAANIALVHIREVSYTGDLSGCC